MLQAALRTRFMLLSIVGGLVLNASGAFTSAQEPAVPHAQDKPPGPALSPAEALQQMTVPPGFIVEAVAHEPDIVNPVAMAIDERGRFWITESFEYPRHEPGPGKDRIKVLEDTDGDGKADKFTIFAEGLNIPSGIAVGHGGVWVANAPDLLFFQDTDGDGKADKQEVVVTGFGRKDTHELPNSLTWGPDGWLYGLNGVFNFSHVKYPEKSPHFKPDHPGWPITCALFRIHPKTREFQVFCEGTSNPWGVAFDHDGSAFISACVIDHLWHLVQSGYYHRQGGAYPPFTWKIGSIVKHKHQKAAYCGIHYFDSDAYPEAYRGRLYMGNIHGGCLNVDSLQRHGSTYAGTGEPDFITANDAWFMPVVQKTGPDGCLYVLDWYDRYHCYQDANRDPGGIDRLKGRLYRIRYQDTPRAPKMDLAQETDDQLLERLGTHNDFLQSTAQRILTERCLNGSQEAVTGLSKKFFELATASPPARAQRRALFLLCSQDRIDPAWHWDLLNHSDPTVRAWAVRATTNLKQLDGTIQAHAADLARDKSRDVQLQVAIAAMKLDPANPAGLLLDVLANCGDDPLIPQIVWQNLHPFLEDHATEFIDHLATRNAIDRTNSGLILPRAFERILSRKSFNASAVAKLLNLLIHGTAVDDNSAKQCLAILTNEVQTGEISGNHLEELKQTLQPILKPIFKSPASSQNGQLQFEVAILLTSWKDAAGFEIIREIFAAHLPRQEDLRIRAFNALVAANDKSILESVNKILKAKVERRRGGPALGGSIDFQTQILAGLGRLSDPRVAEITLGAYTNLESELQPRAIELLTQRADWGKALMAAVANKTVPLTALNLNQVRKLQDFKDPELTKQVTALWGTIRDQRNPQREQVISEMRRVLRQSEGNPHEGQKVFARVCGQCHKIYGQGADVGPDITLNGRSSFEQLLSNVFDPSLVIGASYQARTIVTTEGRALTGLVAEDNDQRVVLKVQGGKQETIPHDQIDESRVSELSLMPEDLEKQLKPQELIDLFAFITLDKPPTDAAGKRLPGTGPIMPRQTAVPAEFNELVSEVAPGFTMTESGEGGVAIIAEHSGRTGVLRTHPISRDKACAMTRTVTLPTDKKSRLVLDVSPDTRGDWRLLVVGNGERLLDEMISKGSTKDGWVSYSVDLSKFKGKDVKLQLINQANDWSFEFGYWGRVELISE
ncbi:MAG: PVC-type heme-binding CxxCH protein [Planctomycetota bacterium]